MIPLFGRRQPRQLTIVEAFEQDRRRAACPDPLLHALVEMAVIDFGRCPAHAADQADFAHKYSSDIPTPPPRRWPLSGSRKAANGPCLRRGDGCRLLTQRLDAIIGHLLPLAAPQHPLLTF